MQKPFIIAEAGINHQGSIDKAKKLIDVAVESNADFVKFHVAYADRILNKKKFDELWSDKHGNNEPFSSFVKRVEFSIDEHMELFEYATEKGIQFMVTPYDIPALIQSLEIGIRNIKLASCDLIKDDFIRLADKESNLLVISTGLATEDEIKHAISLINKDKTFVLHCISEYPTPIERCNLSYIRHLKEYYHVKAGYSDHTDNIYLPLLAVANGAQMVEKHIMLENEINSPDYCVSVTKEKFKEMVYYSKKLSEIEGDGKRHISDQEIINREKFRYRWK